MPNGIILSHTSNIVRQRPQETNENLFIFQPRTVLKCRVNNPSIAKGARTIAYDTVSFGSYLDVIAGMTVLIGTSEGASDVGRIRLRAITPSQMVVSENSDIKWEDDLYITVLTILGNLACIPKNYPKSK